MRMLVTLILRMFWLRKARRAGPGGAGWCLGCRGGAQDVAVTSVIAARAADWSAMAYPGAQAAIRDAAQRLLTVPGPGPGWWSWMRVIDVVAYQGVAATAARARWCLM